MFDWGFALEITPHLLVALVVTFEATAGGMILAMTLGLVWAIARRSRNGWICWPVKGLVEFVRSTPLLVQVYLLFYVFPTFGLSFSPLATGVLALGLHYSAYMSEVYRAGIEGVPKGQWEAAMALNLSRTQIWSRIVLPQAIPPIVPALGNYLISMFKDTPILSAITVLEILQRAKILGSETFRYLEPFTVVGVFFLAISLAAAWMVRTLERKLNGEGAHA